MHIHQCKESRGIKNQVNRISLKATDKAPIIDTKEMVIYELLDKERIIFLLRTFSVLQENTYN